MTPDAHEAFTEEIARFAARTPDVLGVVGLGSSARTARMPDEHSDHDLFLVVGGDRAESYRTTCEWLPESHRIVLAYRETQHAWSLRYDDGHGVELAVFAPEELALAKVNDYGVLFDRADVAARMASVRLATRREVGSEPSDDWLVGEFLTAVVLGCRRCARGEALSGHTFVKQHAIRHLVVLCWRHLTSGDVRRDDLDPHRRLESALPEVGVAVNAALELPVPACAAALPDLAETVLDEVFCRYGRALATVRRVVASASASSSAS